MRERPVQNSEPLDVLQLENRHRTATNQALIGILDLQAIKIKTEVRAISRNINLKLNTH